MSRTDKTAPHRVKVATGRRVEHHDHRNGTCELKADPNRQWEVGNPRQCYVDADWYDPIHRCHCWSCRGGSWADQEHTKKRIEGKQLARSWWREA